MITVHNASKFAVVSYPPYFFKLIIHLGIDVSLRSGSSPDTFDRADTPPIITKFISTDNMENESWYGTTMAPIDRCGSPDLYCTGKCRYNPSSEGSSADVVGVLQTFVIITSMLMVIFSKIQISLSSGNCQRSWEDAHGSSMTLVSRWSMILI